MRLRAGETNGQYYRVFVNGKEQMAVLEADDVEGWALCEETTISLHNGEEYGYRVRRLEKKMNIRQWWPIYIHGERVRVFRFGKVKLEKKPDKED